MEKLFVTHNFEAAPENLPIPEDDGGCDHLEGILIPDIGLVSTDGKTVFPGKTKGRTVIYCYPMTGKPGVAQPEGWDDIPGARGCTPQACSFRDHYTELKSLGAEVYGLSTQDSEYQREMVERLHLPFSVLSDAEMRFCNALRLPTFTIEEKTLVKRLTIIAENGRIDAVHYPVFPSASDPEWVIAWLKTVAPCKDN